MSELSDDGAAQPPAPARSKRNVLLAGCGIGCGVILVLLFMLGIGAYFAAGKVTARVATVVQEVHEKARASGRYEGERFAVYTEIATLAQSGDMGAMGQLLCGGLMQSHFADGELTDDEVTQAEEVLEFLRENPRAPMGAVGQFLETHRDLRLEVNRFANSLLTAPPK